MQRRQSLRLLFWTVCSAALPGCGGGGGGETPAPAPAPAPTPSPAPPPAPAAGPDWPGFARNPQHTALGAIATQDLNRIAWSTPVDLAPQYRPSGALLIHYGSPVISSRNTVVLPVKTGAAGGFRIEARAGATGDLLWSHDTDYLLPPHDWVPSYNPALSAAGRLHAAGAGGKLLLRDAVDAAGGEVRRAVFYGEAAYAADPALYHAAVFINTPVTVDAQGNAWFGFIANGPTPVGLASGIARVGADGTGRWHAAASAANDSAIDKVATNSAPALSADGQTLYVAVNRPASAGAAQSGYLLALDSATLAVKGKTALVDPVTGTPARVTDNATSSPSVGADGRVYYGVLESTFANHHGRGWLLNFDAQLANAGVPGGFGWDITPTLIPAAMVPSYTGPSSYLVAVKYNNYTGRGGDGQNKVAVLDPNASQPDAFSSATVMREVLTLLGPTYESGTSGPIKEWCINTMAADPARRSIMVNSEDGLLYRWDLATNTLSQSLRLNTGLGQAYTPTAIGPDGAVYAISNARLYCVGR